jgi:hypothetical protein
VGVDILANSLPRARFRLGLSVINLRIPLRCVELLTLPTSSAFNVVLGNGYIAESKARNTTSQAISRHGFSAPECELAQRVAYKVTQSTYRLGLSSLGLLAS